MQKGVGGLWHHGNLDALTLVMAQARLVELPRQSGSNRQTIVA